MGPVDLHSYAGLPLVSVFQGLPGSSGLKGDSGENGPAVRPGCIYTSLLLPASITTVFVFVTLLIFSCNLGLFFLLPPSFSSRFPPPSYRDLVGCQALQDLMAGQEKGWDIYRIVVRHIPHIVFRWSLHWQRPLWYVQFYSSVMCLIYNIH